MVIRANGQQAATRHRPEQHLDERSHLHTNPNVTSANLTMGTVTRCRTNVRIWDLQHYEYSANYNTVEASSEGGVRDDRKCLIDYRVREKRCYEGVAILPDRLGFFHITLLLAGGYVRIGESGWCSDGCQTRTHGVPLRLSTFDRVSSKPITPKSTRRTLRRGWRGPV
jgi:hypothetical protein